MNSVLAEEMGAILPSEALNREFDLDAAALAPSDDEATHEFTAHSVLIGNIGLLLPNEEISELVEHQKVCRLPNTAIWFNGITSIRGSMVPVFDLHRLLGIEDSSPSHRMIVIGEHETAVAFWVEGFPRLVTLDDNDILTSAPPIPSLIRDHARKYYLSDGQIWVDWNIESFFETLGEML